MTKTRPFPKAKAVKVALVEGEKVDKKSKKKTEMPRGPICKLCDRKFIIRRIYQNDVETGEMYLMKEMGY
jgi:hypothetical protein